MIQIKPISDLRNKFTDIEKIVNTGEPVYLTKNGYGSMVVLSLEAYSKLIDGVEAALDEANVDQFGTYLQEYENASQFIVITHKKRTMEYANTLYGITMQENGISKLLSMKLGKEA